MTTTQDQNTPTNTLEEKVRDIIFEYGSTNKSVNLGEAKSLIMELISEAVNKAEKNMWDKTTKTMMDILQKNFYYRLMCGEVRDPDGKIDVMQEFVKYQELEPERKKFLNYLEELKAKHETPKQVEEKKQTDQNTPTDTLERLLYEYRYDSRAIDEDLVLQQNPADVEKAHQSNLEETKGQIEAMFAQAVNKAYQKGYNDNSRDCYCDSPGATEGVLSHRHLADDGESHNIKPDINRGETPNQVEEDT